jgi:hypothetical protein
VRSAERPQLQLVVLAEKFRLGPQSLPCKTEATVVLAADRGDGQLSGSVGGNSKHGERGCPGVEVDSRQHLVQSRQDRDEVHSFDPEVEVDVSLGERTRGARCARQLQRSRDVESFHERGHFSVDRPGVVTQLLGVQEALHETEAKQKLLIRVPATAPLLGGLGRLVGAER